MGYWTIWMGTLIGVFLGVYIFRFITHHLKWPTIVGVSVAIIIICVCYLGAYWLEYGRQPDVGGLTGFISGVWDEGVRTVQGFGRTVSSWFR